MLVSKRSVWVHQLFMIRLHFEAGDIREYVLRIWFCIHCNKPRDSVQVPSYNWYSSLEPSFQLFYCVNCEIVPFPCPKFLLALFPDDCPSLHSAFPHVLTNNRNYYFNSKLPHSINVLFSLLIEIISTELFRSLLHWPFRLSFQLHLWITRILLAFPIHRRDLSAMIMRCNRK